MMRNSTFLTGLTCCLLALSLGACGSSKPAAESGEPRSSKIAGGSPPESEFCTAFKSKHCEAGDDEGQSGEKSFASLTPERQQELGAKCEAAVAGANDEKRTAMEQCMSCVSDCRSAVACLDGASLCTNPGAQ
jgi:hypothetical protein